MSEQDYTAERGSLIRVQQFDVSQLPRREDLGREWSFEAAVAPAERAIALFQLVPEHVVPLLPPSARNQLRAAADTVYSLFEQIRNFSAQTPNATAERQGLINSLRDNYETWFNQIQPSLVFSTSIQRDFSRLENEARAAAQSAKDEAARLTAALAEHSKEAERVLEDVRRVAAEQGVGFQAAYFKSEAEKHDAAARTWRVWITLAAALVAVVAAASLFVSKVDLLKPQDAYEAIQLLAAKLVIFTTAGYLVVLCARNFLAHTHNAIVNRHRQNALLTFQALVDAAKGEDKKDIVLTQAAACMFAPQETGFTKHQPEGGPSIIQMLGKLPADKAAHG
ncbi:hypothetical protein J4G48_0046020 [Bradyrhizobium barranii subsp. apii]|uniref:hypothetical protein n=1 Tax=Bradyrhizobium barranii TaxID=2992140 RepID=UPI001AA15081|nr:hypothetical protein [Bradyrhizobium barranii]UPT96298.1 hypothetical protein J4G48_0046020 [Bradyrhizobium barranii subsp. apii]